MAVCLRITKDSMASLVCYFLVLVSKDSSAHVNGLLQYLCPFDCHYSTGTNILILFCINRNKNLSNIRYLISIVISIILYFWKISFHQNETSSQINHSLLLQLTKESFMCMGTSWLIYDVWHIYDTIIYIISVHYLHA